MSSGDPHNLQRFLDAQGSVYGQVLAELRQGLKRSHWMWFVFPQSAGLGSSSMAKTFAIRSIDEAAAYLEHPVLGARLQECTALVRAASGKSIHDIFGSPDDLKFRSCMTLFMHATRDNGAFKGALQEFFAGEEDPLTLERVKNTESSA